MKNIAAISALTLAGITLSAAPVMASGENGNGNGNGHDPVTFCHGGKLHTNDVNGLNGHKTHEGDIFAEDLGRLVTADDCVTPEQPAPLTTTETVTEYRCDAVPPVRIDTTTTKQVGYVHDEDSNKWVLGPEQVTSSQNVSFLTELEVLTECDPVPGDLPTKPETPVVTTPVIQPSQPSECSQVGREISRGQEGYTPKLDGDGDGTACEGATGGTTPVTNPAPETGTPTGTSNGTVPSSSQPLTQTGAVDSTQKPTQLANTGFNWVLFVAGLGLLGAGIAIVRRTRTT